MKLNFKEMMKQEKGITLIALVITIIVLLILAGVTIATLTGDNGILTQAQNAKEKATETGVIERVQVEVAGSYGLDGMIDKTALNDNLRKNISGLTYNGKSISENIEGEGRNRIEELPATVTLNGYKICINKNGEIIKIPEGVSNLAVEIAMNPQVYYGKKVTNYKDDGNTYRIFYVDKDNYFKDGEYTIYLKADDSRAYSNSSFTLTSYANYDSANTKVRTMNPDWAKGKTSDADTATRGNSESGWNTNEKAAAYLCSPVNDSNIETTSLPWRGYYNSSAANYVIGGPSVEMYVKSYNQAYNGITDSNVYTLGAIYRTTSVPGYIYTLNGVQSTISNNDYYTGDDSLDYTRYKSMYCGKTDTTGIASKTGYWWLASPSAEYSAGVCSVGGNDAGLYDGSAYGTDRGVSPLVSLKSSFIPQVEE